MPRPMFTIFTPRAALVWGVALAFASACGPSKKNGAPSASALPALPVIASAAPSSAPSAARPRVQGRPAFDLTDDMKQFMAVVVEDHRLSGAIAKFAAPSLNDRGVGTDPLDSPRVIGTDPSAGDCYVVEGTDGPALHDYLVCWQSGQIIQVADQGMK